MVWSLLVANTHDALSTAVIVCKCLLLWHIPERDTVLFAYTFLDVKTTRGCTYSLGCHPDFLRRDIKTEL